MPSKGFNSILFDVSSIIDDKLTYIKFLKEEYSKEELENYFDADIIFSTSIRDFEKYHIVLESIVCHYLNYIHKLVSN